MYNIAIDTQKQHSLEAFSASVLKKKIQPKKTPKLQLKATIFHVQ